MELFKEILKWVYAVDGAILFLLYVPQIVAAWKDKSGAESTSLVTWGLWTSSSIITWLYAYYVANDWLFTMMSIANTFGCAFVFAISYFRRKQATLIH